MDPWISEEVNYYILYGARIQGGVALLGIFQYVIFIPWQFN